MPITPQIGAKDMVEVCLESSRGELSHNRVENILKLKSRWGLYPQLIGVKKCPPCLNFLLLSSFVFFVLLPWCFFLSLLLLFSSHLLIFSICLSLFFFQVCLIISITIYRQITYTNDHYPNMVKSQGYRQKKRPQKIHKKCE